MTRRISPPTAPVAPTIATRSHTLDVAGRRKIELGSLLCRLTSLCIFTAASLRRCFGRLLPDPRQEFFQVWLGLPEWLRRHVFPTGIVGRGRYHIHVRQIAWTVREDIQSRHPHEQFCAKHNRTVGHRSDARHAINPKLSALSAQLQKEKCNARIDGDVSEAAKHPVAVVIGEDQGVSVYDPDKTRIATLDGAVRPAFGIGSGKEKHRSTLDDAPLDFREMILAPGFVQPVGNAPAVHSILQVAASLMIK